MALFNKDANPIPSKPASRTPPPNQLDMPPKMPGAVTSTADKGSGSEAPKTSESRLIVGPNIKLKGVEIEDCDTLVVEGYVEASMDSRVIEIAESGVYKGKVEIDTAVVRGRFEGELTARERLVVDATGDVSGTIRYGRLAIQEGGRVHGDLDEIANGASRSGATGSAKFGGKKDESANSGDTRREAAE